MGDNDRIADLLRRKLDEIRARDGDLAARAAARRPAAAARPIRRFAEPWQAPAAGEATAVLPGRAPATDVPAVAAPGADPQAFRDDWVARYRGRPLGVALDAGPSDLHRDLWVHRSVVASPVVPVSREAARDALRGALWLLPGVRDATTDRLRGDGAATLDALRDHPRFGPEARRLLARLDRGDPGGLMARVGDRGGRAHPLALALSAFFDPGDFLFLDLETMGLFGGSPIILAGLAHAAPGGTEVVQWIAATPDAERALVIAVGREMASRRALVTFNGRAFDHPYLCARAAFYGAPILADPVHFDLLGFSRRTWRGRVPDCRLDTLARHVLGMTRDFDVPGSLVPAFYQDYLRDPDERVGLLAAIVVHNRHDMEQTVRLFTTLCAGVGATS